MSVPRQAARLVRPARSARTWVFRPLSTSSPVQADEPVPPPEPPQVPVPKGSRFNIFTPKPLLPSTPYTLSAPPQFPAPNDPFTQPSPSPPVPTTDKSGVPVSVSASTTAGGGGEYSDTTKAVVRGVARLMGYNSKASTAIRETGRMMRGVVESIERDRVYWYEECGLPLTYQTFFQLHLLYVLILLPRLRALAVNPSTTHEIPEPLDPSQPHHPTPDLAQSTTNPSSSTSLTTPSPSSSSTPILTKPEHESYPSELLNHFFELAESEMRKVLGRGERERVVKKYMSEMGEQWKGAGAGLDYVMGLSQSEVTEESRKADVELASWVWRNLYASQGLTEGGAAMMGGEEKEAELMKRLEEAVVFIRKEMARLDSIEDVDVLAGNIGAWGSARS